MIEEVEKCCLVEPGKSEIPFVHTLAQPGTPDKKSKGNPLKRRAVSKYISNEIILPLIDLESDLKKSYWNTFHCASVLLQDGQKVTGRYCNNRWCLVCNRIRTAKMINDYGSVIKSEIKKPFFVTLTIPNVTGSELRETIKGMIKNMIAVNYIFRHRKDYRLKGIRKLECTFNPISNEFHPHFHLIVDGDQAGTELINQWLKRYPDATRKAQNIKKADENSMIELFKYTTKIVTGKDITRTGTNIELNINPEALDTIFKAMQRLRVFQAMGIKKVEICEDIEEIQGQEIEGIEEKTDVWLWEQSASDWVSADGELLTGCNANKIYKLTTNDKAKRQSQ